MREPTSGYSNCTVIGSFRETGPVAWQLQETRSPRLAGHLKILTNVRFRLQAMPWQRWLEQKRGPVATLSLKWLRWPQAPDFNSARTLACAANPITHEHREGL